MKLWRVGCRKDQLQQDLQQIKEEAAKALQHILSATNEMELLGVGL